MAGNPNDHDAVDRLLRTLTGFAETGAEISPELVTMIDAIIPVAIWAYSSDGQTLAMSRRWARITGQTPGRFQQQEWRDAIHPDDREPLAADWAAFAASDRETWSSEYRVVRVDTGAVRLVTSRGVRLPPGSGMSFVGVTEDVTERVQAEAEVRRLAAEQAALRRVAELVAARPDPAAVAEAVSREVVRLFDADAGGLVRFDDDGTGVVTGWTARGPEAALPAGTSIDLTEPHAVSSVYATGEAVRMGRSTVPVEIEFVERVAVPVRVGGSLWGALALVAGHPIEAGAEERIAKFAGLVALAVAESDARAAARLRVAQQAAVNELSALALAGTPIDGLLDAAMQRVVDVLAAPSATLVQSLGAGEAVIRAAAGEATAAGTRFAVAPDTVEGAVLAEGASLIVEDFAVDARFAEGPATTRAGMTGAATCPVRLPDRLWGAVCVFTARRRQFTADDVGFLESVANMLGSAIERATAEETIRHQALHDALTGIPNRTLLVDRLEQALERAGRTDTLVGVLYIDLDRFQDVNDTYGHPTGDALLIAVAEELSAAIRPGDTIARIGGDEFAVVAEGLVAPEEALALGDRLLRALHDPKAGLSGASVGVAVRRHGDSPSDAMRDADTALYRAKAAGRGRIELFDNEMRARMLDRLRTEADLTEALERNQLELFYQPIVSLVDGSITGLEGLIRWRHPTRGLIPPVAFVPIAEETNAIIDIGRFVIARACADAARWNARDTGDRTLAISVNLSPLQLADVGLPEFVATSIAASGIAPAQLGLEITESAVLDDDPSHAALLLQLKRLGVQLVLDDFGTGYSSLSHLRRVPLACVKLDRSFVSGIGTDDRATAIVVAVRQLARALGLVVIAEGVETADQVAALQGIGCELAQGYYFARPMERDRIDALLDAGEPWRLETALPAGDD